MFFINDYHLVDLSYLQIVYGKKEETEKLKILTPILQSSGQLIFVFMQVRLKSFVESEPPPKFSCNKIQVQF